MKSVRIGILSVLVVGLAVFAAARRQGSETAPDGYKVTATIPLPGEGGWDYLGIDLPNHNLYISHGNEVLVVDVRNNHVVGTITPTPGTHGVGISDKDGHGFTSNSGNSTGATMSAEGRTMASSSFTEFDIKTFKVIKEIPLPIAGSDGIMYDPATDRVFAFSHTKKAVAVDARTGDVVGTIDLPGSPEFAVPDDRGNIFDNLEDVSHEIEIDAKTLKVTNDWPLDPCESPSGLAMDTHSRRLFVGCHNNMMAVMDADTGKVLATPAIGGGVDATRFDPGTHLAFSSNGSGDGSITVVREDNPSTFTLLGNIPTQPGARTMEVDTQTHTLYTVTAKFEAPAAPPPGGAAPEAGRGRGRGGRRAMVPGSFVLLVITK